MCCIYVLEHRGRCYSKGEGNVTPRFLPRLHDVYNVINRGEELKEKAPPSIFVGYVLAMGIVADGISCYPAHYNLESCKHAHKIK